MKPSDYIALAGLFFAFLSIYLNYKLSKKVDINDKLSELRASVMEVFKSSNDALLEQGDGSVIHFKRSTIAYKSLFAACRDDLELDSLMSQAELQKPLSAFYRCCVADDICKIEFNSDEGIKRQKQMEDTRRSLVEAMKKVIKKL